MANEQPAPAPVAAGSMEIAAALMRSSLFCFLWWVFALLHPGASLKPGWYLLAMTHKLQQAAAGKTTRLVINVPPRHLKSISASVALVVWILGHNPAAKIMIVTYSAELARQHAEPRRIIMQHPFYQWLFPHTRLANDGVRQQVLRTTAGGGCRSTTVGGSTTGFGADYIIIDDCMKADDIVSEARRDELDRFFRGTLLTRLNNKKRGVIISIQQRLGEDDLPGRLLEAGAEHLSLPAYDDKEVVYDLGFGRCYRRSIGEVLRPEDEPREVLDQFRREMGPRDFATQYLQQPSALEGNIIRTEQFPRYCQRNVACGLVLC